MFLFRDNCSCVIDGNRLSNKIEKDQPDTFGI